MNILDDVEQKMKKAIESMEFKLNNVRAGRANPSMLSGIMVSYYGSATPIQSVANITVPEARKLMIKPFDRSIIKEIERAINEANLGLTPTNNGEVVYLTIPELTMDKRKEYVKQAKTIMEEAKVALRNAREDGRNSVKRLELPEDEVTKYNNDIQDLINKYNRIVEDKYKEKEEELMTV